MKTYTRSLTLTLTGLLLIAGLTQSAPEGFAAEFGKTCDLAVYPYNPAAASDTIGAAGNGNILNDLSNRCADFVQYDRAYSPQPPDPAQVPVKAGSENLRVPIAQHQHAYFNSSDSAARDPGIPNQVPVFYRAIVKAFEIKLQEDAVNNITLSSLTCLTPPPPASDNFNGSIEPIADCDGSVSGLYGGTTVSKRRVGSTLIVRWEFGTGTTPSQILPFVWGKNGANFDTGNGRLNLSDPTNRKFEFAVNLPTHDTANQAWSATTTSRVLLADQAVLQSHYNAGTRGSCVGNNLIDPASGWCFLTPKPGFERSSVSIQRGNGELITPQFFWYNIGSVSSLWKKPPQPPKLKLVKTVINQFGGHARATDFALYVTPLVINGESTRVATGQKNTFAAGRYRASEDNLPGYTASQWGGDCAADGTVTLAAGDDKTCTITNSDTPARITIIKQVINDDGGTARVQDFTLTLNAREVTSGEANTVAPGSYIAHELLTPAQQQAYIASSWTGDCQPDGRVTLAAGDDKTCVITNNDRPSAETRLTLIKQVINDNGGILGPQNFPLFVNDQLVVTGVTTIFAPGNYTVRETSQAGYVASGWSGDCSADGQVTLSAGENKTCLIINDDLPFTPPPPPPPPPLDICPNIPGNQLYVPVGLIRDINGNCVPPVIDFCPNIPGLQPAIPPGLVLDARGNCVQLLRPQGTLEKRGFSLPARGNVIQLGQQAQYELNFQALSPLPHVTIWDTMRPTLVGDKGGELTLDLNAFDGRPFAVQRVTPTGSQPLFRCDEQPDARVRTCYRGSPFTNNGLTVFNLDTLERVVILYRATLTRSAITAEFCKNLPREFCGEKFKNEARDSLGNVAGQFLYTPCPFLLTRGIGDVILERDLSVGSDILSCSGLPNIEGPVIRPEIPTPPMETPRTGPDDIINVPRHTVCKQSNQNTSSIPEAFRNPFQSLSSGICELSLNLSDDLTRPAIEKAILANVTRFTRFNDNLGVGTARTLTNLTEQPDAPLTNPNAAVYKLKGANLTIDPFVQPVGSGSRTYIIEDGDLIINGNVRFDENVTINSFKDTPSIAFIVINGSIRIAPTVTELDGVYVALKGESENSGKIFGSAPSERSLVVDGSIVGDLEPLFESRSYIGDARRNQGTIVINYGGWLFYNLPPVLRDIITIQEEQVAR